MAVDFDALTLLPCLDAFGEAAQGQPVPVWTLSAGRTVAADGIFDRHGANLTFDANGASASIMQPRIFVRAADFPADAQPQQDMRVSIRGFDWAVTSARPDGLGGITVTLGDLGLGFNP
jgi:hypothetical protein